MLRRVIGRLSHALKSLRMTDIFPAASEAVAQSNTTKRELEDAADHDDAASKKQRTEGKPMQGRPDRKRKVAMLLSYSGAGYYGMQINTGYDTIESELCKALVAAGLIPQEHADNMSKMSFQRAARTDKGVSALGQVVSLKMTLDRDNVVEEINKHLPDQIRVMGIIRTTKSFNSKNFCGGRTYVYMLPTYAFAPVEKFIDEEYRIPDETIKRVNEVLVNFKGTHNFHNYTSGIKPDDPSAKRYMLGLECGRPFLRDNLEFVKIRVQGQSFMLHHIRKMIGVTISIVRGYAGEDLLAKTWGTEKVDIPKAPGLGLMLDTLHYDGYNKKFGSDGIHKELEWSDYREKIDEFAEKNIFSNIVKTEKEERSMFNWLTTLPHHSFDVRQEGTSLLFKAHRNVLAHDGAVNDAGSTECAEKELADVSETTAIKSESDQNNGDQTTTISEQDAQTEDKKLKQDVS